MSDTIRIPCVSLWQPWCFWVGLGWKTAESRTHRRFASLEGKTIGIHVGAKWDEKAIDAARPYLLPVQIALTKALREAGGRIGWLAKVNAHTLATKRDEPAALIECTTERYALHLSEVRSLPVCDATSVKGRQGIFYVELPRSLVSPVAAAVTAGEGAEHG